jgi:iron(II)-dependent oxidoreductase
MEHENKKAWLQRPPTAHDALLASLHDARARMDAHFQLVHPDAFYERPIHERHRVIFYLGHVDAFDWNLLGVDALGMTGHEPTLDRLFAFGIDPLDGDALPSDTRSDWPSLDRVVAYTRQLRRRLDDALGTPIARRALLDGVRLNTAIEHRLMHAETFTYMLHRLPLERKLAKPHSRPATDAPPELRAADIPHGTATLGLRRASGAFGWDNEFEERTVDVGAFRIDVHPVRNGLYRQFVEAGGYQARALWTDDDWQWRSALGLEHPVDWSRRDGRWMYRGPFAVEPLSQAAPVYVSQAEASAYARWRGARLPTEAEWHRAAYGTKEGIERSYPWGEAAPGREHGCFDFASFDPAPVGWHPRGASAFGVEDLVGNGWEWTSTTFAPFDGFSPAPFYPGYSADFFDGRHFVLKGGSPRTASSMLRRSFRNWFQGRYPYVYATFRCVEA